MRVWRLGAEESELDQRRAASALRARGLDTGDRVALVLPNSPALLSTVIGALRAGIVPVLLHPGLLPNEREPLIKDAEPSLVIDDTAALEALLEGAAGPAGSGATFGTTATPDFCRVPRARPMQYTSGTSGTPKGVWSGILDDAEAQAMFDDERGIWNFTDDDTLLICSPLYHSAAVRFSTSVLLSGGSVVLAERFDALTVLDAVRSYRPTAAFMVPAHLHRLFASGQAHQARQADAPAPDDVASFRLLVHAGAPCPEPLKRQAIDVFPPGAVWEFYGSTEGQFTVCSPEDWLSRPGTVGRARPGRTIRTDADGQVWCQAPPFARFEYWRDPDKSAQAWSPDKTEFTVGDLGRIDDEGFLYLDGRRDDLIISGGVNIYPAEVERELARTPGVHEVAVFGVPDERWGQRVCVAAIGTATPDDIRRHAAGTLSAHKRPKEVFVVDDLPRTITGKVRRTAVAEALGFG